MRARRSRDPEPEGESLRREGADPSPPGSRIRSQTRFSLGQTSRVASTAVVDDLDLQPGRQRRSGSEVVERPEQLARPVDAAHPLGERRLPCRSAATVTMRMRSGLSFAISAALSLRKLSIVVAASLSKSGVFTSLAKMKR